MIIAQITDLHLRTKEQAMADGICTIDRLAAAIAHLKQLDPRPDILIVTGDVVDEPNEQAYMLAQNMLGDVPFPVYLLPGNHDDRSIMRKIFTPKAAPYFATNTGHLSYCITDYPPKIIALDSVRDNHPGGTFCDDRLDWLKDILQEEPDRPTILFMHHPPFATGITVMDKPGFLGSEALHDLVSRHPQIQYLVFGHIHRPIMTTWAGKPACVSPSAAFQLLFPLDTEKPVEISNEPPVVALHHWDQASGVMTHFSPITFT